MDVPAADAAVHPQFRFALSLLEQAREYAAELARSPWDFAVEIAVLREAGLTNSDLRWLVCREYVVCKQDVTTRESSQREFEPGGPLIMTGSACFVLTETGARLARDGLQEPTPTSTGHNNGHSRLLLFEANGNHRTPARTPSPPSAPEKPKWDRDRHEFRLGDRLIKVYKLPSPNQEAILMALEEEGWPPRIDDPLPLHPDIDPKRRLHDAIKGLNRNQKSRLVRFMGDGTGEGIRWEFRSP